MKIQEQPGETISKARESEDTSPLESNALYRLGLNYGRLVYRFRWYIIALWVVIVLVSVPFAAQIGSVLKGGGYSSKDSESARASTLIKEKLPRPATQLLVIFQSATTAVSDPLYQKEVNDFVSRARSFSHVTGVVQSGTGLDGRTTYVTVNFNTGADTVEGQLNDFRTLLPTGATAGPAQAYLTGEAPFNHDFSQITVQDTERAEYFALPLALLVLLVVFGTLVGAAMPILLAIVAVSTTMAVIYSIGLHVSMSVFVLNISSIIGLGISIDYSLFMIRRYRDELAAGRSISDATGWTIATAGESILFSGLIVMIGFCGLLLIGVDIMTSLGIGGAVVVAISVLSALTLLPSLLAVLGHRINALRIPYFSRLTMHRLHLPRAITGENHGKNHGEEPEEERHFWQRWAMGVMKRPVLIILLVTALLIGLGWPIFSMNLGSTSSTSVPTSFESRQGLDILNAQFPETKEHPVYIVVQTPGRSSMLTQDNLAKLDHLSTWIATRAHVTDVISLTRIPATPGAPTLSEQQLATLYSTGAYQNNPTLAQFVASTTNGNMTLITVRTKAKVDSSEGKALVNDLRAGDKAAAQGLTVLVGGDQANSLDFTNHLYGNFHRERHGEAPVSCDCKFGEPGWCGSSPGEI